MTNNVAKHYTRIVLVEGYSSGTNVRKWPPSGSFQFSSNEIDFFSVLKCQKLPKRSNSGWYTLRDFLQLGRPWFAKQWRSLWRAANCFALSMSVEETVWEEGTEDQRFSFKRNYFSAARRSVAVPVGGEFGIVLVTATWWNWILKKDA